MTIRKTVWIIVALILALFGAGFAAQAKETPAPGGLGQWKSWVLWDREGKLCPCRYNDGEARVCAWPSTLELQVQEKQGGFSQNWLVFAETWVPLPGGPGAWPEGVTVDGKAAVVVNRGGVPHMKLESGSRQVKGRFSWDRPPEMVQAPPASGLVKLTVNGKEKPRAAMDEKGRLWLQKEKGAQREEDTQTIRVRRKITDNIPMQVETRVLLDVAGQGREIQTASLLLARAVPMKLVSKLPVRVTAEGKLLIQARPGRWEIRLYSRFPGPVDSIGPVAKTYGREIWVFEAMEDLRLVRVEGPPQVDPGQTGLPDEWRSFPAYVMEPGQTMGLVTLRRGDPDPPPDRLKLARTWWLDFDGKAFTIRDRITGDMHNRWSLAMNPPEKLGRVKAGGELRLITYQSEKKLPGVQIRRGKLDLDAVSRMDRQGADLPVSGWDHGFESVSGVLNLPPGWGIFAASGVDTSPGTWITRWTLWDIFLVCIIALGLAKLFGWKWGLAGLATLLLTWHAPNAPRTVWLHLLAAMALVRVLDAGWVKSLAQWWRLVSVLVLLVITVPFVAAQFRTAIYPQLENPSYRGGGDPLSFMACGTSNRMATVPIPEAAMEQQAYLYEKDGELADHRLPLQKRSYSRSNWNTYKKAALDRDPQALVQTGPGLPGWSWRELNLTFAGPASVGQTFRLWLMPPWAGSLLSVLGALFLVVLVFGVLKKGGGPGKTLAKAAAASLVFCLLAAPALAGEYPSQQLLNEYQNRLLKPPDCLPHCADLARMEVQATEEGLRFDMEVHAAAQTAVPLPGAAGSWLPKAVWYNGQPAKGLFRDPEGVVWLFVEQGVHRVGLSGPAPAEHSFQVPLALIPHQVKMRSQGFEVTGLTPEGGAGPVLGFTREKRAETVGPAQAPMVLPPFLSVERRLLLGRQWTVQTTVTRLTPEGSPVSVSIPLLPGESVTQANIQVDQGRAQVHLGPRDTKAAWLSTLGHQPALELIAPGETSWSETWILDASPIWKLALSGIAPIHTQDSSGQWAPTWRPWPGEKVKIGVTRPKAVPGQVKTLEKVSLEWTLGSGQDLAQLDLTIRSSQGVPHRVRLPEGAVIQEVRMDGKTKPLSPDKDGVLLSLHPGSQDATIRWRQPSGSSLVAKGPKVGLGGPAVNATVIAKAPRRWILWAKGPMLGPAVLFWSYLLVMALAAAFLGRMRQIPIKTLSWFLLGLGLTQVNPLAAVAVALWLPVIAWCAGRDQETWAQQALVQLCMLLSTVIALACLFAAVQHGLLGLPRMQIAGNGSGNFTLRWFSDRVGDELFQPSVISAPLWVFRVLMLAWSLWLAKSLVEWLGWIWSRFPRQGLLVMDKKLKESADRVRLHERARRAGRQGMPPASPMPPDLPKEE